MNTKLNQIQDWQSLAQQANWSVTKLAKQCNISARTLRRHFLKEFGKTPKSWLNEQRQKNALELLQDGSSIKETAGLMGYQYSNTFSREFKKHFFQRPSNLVLKLTASVASVR